MRPPPLVHRPQPRHALHQHKPDLPRAEPCFSHVLPHFPRTLLTAIASPTSLTPSATFECPISPTDSPATTPSSMVRVLMALSTSPLPASTNPGPPPRNTLSPLHS